MASAKKVAAKKAAPSPKQKLTVAKINAAKKAFTGSKLPKLTKTNETLIKSAVVAEAQAEQRAGVKVIDGVKVYVNVELPQRAVSTVSDLDKLAVGDSLFFDATIDTSVYTDDAEGKKAQREAAAVKANRANGQVRRYTKRHPDTKFIVRTVPNAKAMGFDGEVGVAIKRTK